MFVTVDGLLRKKKSFYTKVLANTKTFKHGLNSMPNGWNYKQFGLILLIISSLWIFGGLFVLDAFLKTPLPLNKTVSVEIQQGMTGYDIGKLLKKNEVIHSVRSFRWALWLMQAEKELTIGTKRFHPPLSLKQLINKLRAHSPLLKRVQIPEGWPSWRIFAHLSQRLNIPEQQFRNLFNNNSFLKKHRLRASNFEGYLFPDTYYFSADANSRDVIVQMVNRFWEIADSVELRERANEYNLSLDEAVVLASIIEKEARFERERHLISAVFHNRLQKNILLQADPTILYIYKNYEIPITESMLRRDHPYNTYVNKGLPPGAISNPGRASLEASTRPADVPYLYFVSKQDGSHEFSQTLQEHKKAIEEYQR